MRWRFVLPFLGLALFAVLSWNSVRWNDQLHLSSRRYFWWASVRLDPDPLDRRSRPRTPCANEIGDCAWYPESIWITRGWMQKALMISALPAFAASLAIVHGLGRLGVSQVASFMACTPVSIFAWFYFVGWLLDRRRQKAISHPRKTNSSAFTLKNPGARVNANHQVHSAAARPQKPVSNSYRHKSLQSSGSLPSPSSCSDLPYRSGGPVRVQIFVE